MRRRFIAPFLLIAGPLVAPASASALSVQFSSADVPVRALSPGITSRDPEPTIRTVVGADEVVEYTLEVKGPGGRDALDRPARCLNIGVTRLVRYVGNGPYTLTLTRCGGGLPQSTTFAINTFDTVSAPAGELLMRDPGSYVSREHPFGVGLAPGNVSHNLAVVPVGSATPTFTTPVVNQTSIGLRFNKPGAYNVAVQPIARGSRVPGPVSRPAVVRVLAPFDIRRMAYPDSRGPSYRVTAYLGEASARGKVRISLARGRKGGKYRRLGTARIRNGKVSKRFKARRSGSYRLKFTYAGSATVAPGSGVVGIRVFRRYFRR